MRARLIAAVMVVLGGTLLSVTLSPHSGQGTRLEPSSLHQTQLRVLLKRRSEAAQQHEAPAASSLGSGAPHRPLHLPHLRPGTRCPINPSQTARWGTDGLQTLAGRGPVYLIGDGRISIALSARDRLGWRGQKTPWAIRRSYDGPILVRGARIGRRGQVRFAYGYGDHLHELHWGAGADQGLPPDPGFRFLASATLFRAPGCYAFQIDGTSFSEIVVARVTG